MDLESRTEIGKGRSGTVFRVDEPDGRKVAVKRFSSGSFLTKLVNYILTGGPNAYQWDSDAANTLYYRRKILGQLVPYWTDDSVKVPGTYSANWDESSNSWELRTEFVEGRPASLHSPFSKKREHELDYLIKGVMQPLQEKLIDSGFYGLTWQAGKGNPVAQNNFLYEEKTKTWAWIDLESGVPAFVPISKSFFTFYLPRAIKQKRPLFDDVDIKRLRDYLSKEEKEISIRIDKSNFEKLLSEVDFLEYYQDKWKTTRRVDRSIIPQVQKQNITPQQAEWFSKHPFNWYAHETRRHAQDLCEKVFITLPKKVYESVTSQKTWQDLEKSLKNFGKFVFLEQYRTEAARTYLRGRIEKWEKRKQMNKEQGMYLRQHIDLEQSSSSLTDLVAFGFIMKPAEYITRAIIIPYLAASRKMSLAEAGFLQIWLGSILRTGYTSLTIGKTLAKDIPACLKGSMHGRSLAKKMFGKLITLGVGMIPEAGNAAYPIEMIYSESVQDQEIGRFLLYDILTRMGGKIPIIGGKDTRTEHFFNHLGDIFVRKREMNLN